MLENNQTKKCSKCSEIKPLDEFYGDKTKKDGKQSQCKECQKAYRQDHREKLVGYQKKYYDANRDNVAAQRKQYRQTKKGKAVSKNSNQKRCSKIREGEVTIQEILDFQHTATHCYWCNTKFTKKMKVHIDHYVPLSNGGKHTLSNLVAFCQKCNLTKKRN